VTRPPPEPRTGEGTATLVINSDYSYCSACGEGAVPEESSHVSIRWREMADGWARPRGEQGCGATFTATATDSFDRRIGPAILEMRPDLPFHGTRGVDFRA
jgi:hypothetical protein